MILQSNHVHKDDQRDPVEEFDFHGIFHPPIRTRHHVALRQTNYCHVAVYLTRLNNLAHAIFLTHVKFHLLTNKQISLVIFLGALTFYHVPMVTN